METNEGWTRNGGDDAPTTEGDDVGHGDTTPDDTPDTPDTPDDDATTEEGDAGGAAEGADT